MKKLKRGTVHVVCGKGKGENNIFISYHELVFLLLFKAALEWLLFFLLNARLNVNVF